MEAIWSHLLHRLQARCLPKLVAIDACRMHANKGKQTDKQTKIQTDKKTNGQTLLIVTTITHMERKNT